MEVGGRHTVEILASPTTCLVEVMAFEAYPDWYPGVREVEVRSRDDDGRGALVALLFDPGVPGLGAIPCVLHYRCDPPHRVWTRYLEGRPHTIEGGQWVFELTTQGASRVSHEVRVVMDTGLPRLLERGLRGQARHLLIEQPVQRLKVRLEGAEGRRAVQSPDAAPRHRRE